MATYPDRVIEAAGGVVWRRVDDRVQILLIHRPDYDDWSLPKGKLDPGEAADECALREVREETGLSCVLGPALAPTHYVDRRGGFKRVRYWAMQVRGGEFTVNAEVDEIRWLHVDEAVELLTYRRDRKVLSSFGAVATATS